MNGTIIDANVLIDAFDPTEFWHEWSCDAILLALHRGPLVLNPITYAELSVPFESPAELDVSISPEIERRALPWSAAFLAGKAFQQYRRRGGNRRSPMPDFYIGAHAAVERLDVLTRDPSRIASYFPTVNVISPI